MIGHETTVGKTEGIKNEFEREKKCLKSKGLN